ALGCVVRFEVTDTGIGIPQDKLGALFTSFGQLDGSTTRKFGGAGLGLAISKQIVERMGGSIGVVSAPGKGSTFWFTVRFGNAESAATAEIPLERSASEVESLPPARVLLAEDNKTNQVLVRSLLERKGCSVDIVATGFEAVEAVARGGYDLVLMDVQMPGMDGFEATRRIRSHERSDSRPAVPIVALTAHALKGDREACLSCGMDEYISKPIEASQLYAAIRRFASEATAPRRLG
ncbi:MAG TPA: response regulator, partial [Polyangiaceae bacterium]|nr:response regulator [Polyangiaceae bacterium]